MKSCLLFLALPLLAADYDIAVYGSTPAGIASAVVAARQGHRVILLEPTKHFGGLLTGGLSNTDFRTLEAVTGFYREYMDRAHQHYIQTYGPNSIQAEECFFGAHTEPHVSEKILRQMIAEQKTLTLVTEHYLRNVQRNASAIQQATFRTPAGSLTVNARLWIDATYEGDLAAAAKVPYRIGRESTREYGERFAGVLFFDQGKILPGSTGEADTNEQCANFRIIMTNRPSNRLPVPRPPGYNRDEFLKIIPHLTSGRVKTVYSTDHSGMIRLTHIPNDKSDMNDIKQAVVRLSLPGENNGWADGDEATRKRIYDRHVAHNIGLIHFLQNDPDVPAHIREKANEWGLAKDEYAWNNHLPPALYVREGRRIYGDYIFTEHDTMPASRSVRATLKPDAIAMGDYSLNSHGHQPAGPLYPTLFEGDFGFSTTPFMIPYGTIVPKGISNLLVPVAVSASHVGYSALRLEPTWTALGHAAGLAAHLALSRNNDTRAISLPALQRLLHQQKQATIYTSDIPRESPLFVPVQWAGLRGLLSDIVDYNTAVMVPLKHRYGTQYSYAHSNHAVEPAATLTPQLKAKWIKRLPCAAKVNAETRGAFFTAAYAACAE
ncbi:MAG: FAD-dependent oxidoreductase [Acidobacteria bacterium]|nr:FAD-dependent oxidoreductase [Acidobacteriota bacterium]